VPFAFFDLDKTLCRKDSSELFAVALARRGLIHPWAGAKFAWGGIQYKLGLKDRASMQMLGFATYRGARLADLAAALREVWEPNLVPGLSPAALARLREHQERGDEVVIVTASPRFVVAPARQLLGVQAFGTTMALDGDRLTGAIDGHILEGPEKAKVVRRLCAEAGVDAEACWAYSDSILDRAFLEAVGKPVAVGPDAELATVARDRGWPVLQHDAATPLG
jgi:HAD superfamily hydrolase (TIGR01490 family)